MVETILFTLLKVNLAASAAILIVLALRAPARRVLGARGAYRMWLIVPVAALAVLIPARQIAAPPAPAYFGVAVEEGAAPAAAAGAATAMSLSAQETGAPQTGPGVPVGGILLTLWLLGAVAMLGRAIAGTRRFTADPQSGPALIGVLRPTLILPRDFTTRFDAREQSLILAHEEAHRAGGHAALNALTELARCACWFNPLAHAAVAWMRADQELACDAAVVAAHPRERSAYARALLKSQTGSRALPLGCAWPGGSGKGLKTRVEMLDRRIPGRRRAAAGAAAVILIGALSGVAAWAAQPGRIAAPDEVWTPSAEAPAGVLTELEADRHDRAIARAQAGDIDIVFFGTTNTEMWAWPDRGRAVWDRTLAPRNAANFGSQGTRPESLLWRMRNGELDGYQARLVVLSAFCCIEAAVQPEEQADLLASYEPVLAEIRARQPEAKILILADFPRGTMPLAEWRQVAAQNAAAHAALVDGETVFWADFGERFYGPGDAHQQNMWARPGAGGVGVGMQPAGFEAWAEAMQPWIERFVR